MWGLWCGVQYLPQYLVTGWMRSWLTTLRIDRDRHALFLLRATLPLPLFFSSFHGTPVPIFRHVSSSWFCFDLNVRFGCTFKALHVLHSPWHNGTFSNLRVKLQIGPQSSQWLDKLISLSNLFINHDDVFVELTQTLCYWTRNLEILNTLYLGLMTY